MEFAVVPRLVEPRAAVAGETGNPGAAQRGEADATLFAALVSEADGRAQPDQAVIEDGAPGGPPGDLPAGPTDDADVWAQAAALALILPLPIAAPVLEAVVTAVAAPASSAGDATGNDCPSDAVDESALPTPPPEPSGGVPVAVAVGNAVGVSVAPPAPDASPAPAPEDAAGDDVFTVRPPGEFRRRPESEPERARARSAERGDRAARAGADEDGPARPSRAGTGRAGESRQARHEARPAVAIDTAPVLTTGAETSAAPGAAVTLEPAADAAAAEVATGLPQDDVPGRNPGQPHRLRAAAQSQGVTPGATTLREASRREAIELLSSVLDRAAAAPATTVDQQKQDDTAGMAAAAVVEVAAATPSRPAPATERIDPRAAAALHETIARLEHPDLSTGHERHGRGEGSGRRALDPPVVRREEFTSPAATIVTAIPDALKPSGAESQAVTAHRPAGGAADDVPQQVVRAIRLQWRDGIGEARLRLQPEHLGEVVITLKLEGNSVSAVVRAESAAAQAAIEAGHQQLRSALDDQGLRLTRLSVQVHPDAERQSDRRPAEQQPSRRTRRPSGTAPLFEVKV